VKRAREKRELLNYGCSFLVEREKHALLRKHNGGTSVEVVPTKMPQMWEFYSV
jgi:hypothetical protein